MCAHHVFLQERWSSSIAEFDIQLEAKVFSQNDSVLAQESCVQAKQGPSPPMHQLPELAASIDGDLFALRPGSNEVLWEVSQ